MLEKLRLGNGNKQNKKELKREYNGDPLEVLITPDGKVVRISLDKQSDPKPQGIIAQSDEPVTNQEQNTDKSVMPNESLQSTRAGDPASRNKNRKSCEAETRSASRGQGKKRNTLKPVASVHVGRKSTIKCKVCQKVFSRTANYKEHMMKHEGKYYHCQKCNKKFASRAGLLRHVQHHTGKYRYTCGACQKGFTQLCIFQDHVKKHKGESYACQMCEKSFTTASYLKKHMQHHTGKYSHICQICQKGFVEIQGLQEHMMKHEGKSFTCHICEKTYSCPRTLQRHMKSHNVVDKEAK